MKSPLDRQNESDESPPPPSRPRTNTLPVILAVLGLLLSIGLLVGLVKTTNHLKQVERLAVIQQSEVKRLQGKFDDLAKVYSAHAQSDSLRFKSVDRKITDVREQTEWNDRAIEEEATARRLSQKK